MADTHFCGSERAFWVLPHRGPSWTWSAQERGVNGVWGAQGCGLLTWECASSLANGNIFLFVPWMGPCCFFLCLCLQQIRMAWWGVRGGLTRALPRSHPLSKYEERALDATSPRRGMVSDDGVGFPCFTRRWAPGPCPTKGSASPSCGLKPTLMAGHCGLSGSPPRGQRRVGGGAFTDDGTCSMGAELSVGQSSRGLARTESRWRMNHGDKKILAVSL